MPPDLDFWNRLFSVAFDDVARDICATERSGDSALLADARVLTAHFLRCFCGVDGLRPDPAVARNFDRVLRGTLFVRFRERVRYWLERLPEVEEEYQRRVRTLRNRCLTAEELQPYLDRPD